MGDVIHTLPAVHALRETFPAATIGWIIEERWAELLCAPGTPRRGPRSAERPLVDWVHTVSLAGWGKSFFSWPTLQRVATLWNDVRDTQYDLAVDLQGAIRSAVIAHWSGARVVCGAANPRETPASLWYTRPVITNGAHVIEQYLSVARALADKKMIAPPVQFPRHAESEGRVRQLLEQHSMSEFAILNPGAGWGAKRWPAGRYGEVARNLAEHGVRSILNYGPGEKNLVREAEAASAGAAVAMETSISELIALTRRARLFVGGDTGPLHLAAALGVPVVGIFGPTDPARNGPFHTRSIVLRNPASSTSHSRRSAPDEGMLEIVSQAVTTAARELLSGPVANGLSHE